MERKTLPEPTAQSNLEAEVEAPPKLAECGSSCVEIALAKGQGLRFPSDLDDARLALLIRVVEMA